MAPWQQTPRGDPQARRPRGSTKNTNGLLRQFFPKGTDLSTLSQTELNDVARLMNQRPRKPSDGKPPKKPRPKTSRPSDQTLHLKLESKGNWCRSRHAPTQARNAVGAIGGRQRTMTMGGVGAGPDLRKDESPVWQKRFWEHHIRNADDYAAHSRYCWINPVKHGLVEKPEDWPWSSYHRDGVVQ